MSTMMHAEASAKLLTVHFDALQPYNASQLQFGITEWETENHTILKALITYM